MALPRDGLGEEGLEGHCQEGCLESADEGSTVSLAASIKTWFQKPWDFPFPREKDYAHFDTIFFKEFGRLKHMLKKNTRAVGELGTILSQEL